MTEHGRQATEGSGRGTPPFRVHEIPDSLLRAKYSAWAITGGLAVFLGSLLPFVSFSDPDLGVIPSVKPTNALFGLIMLGLGIALRGVPYRFYIATAVTTLCLSALGALGYALTIVAGQVGVTEQDSFGFPVRVTFSPGIGILLMLAGCVAAGLAGIGSLQHHRS